MVPVTPDERVQKAVAICRATLLGSESFRSEADGGIYTRIWLRVNEALKGKFPATITVVQRGGMVGVQGEVFCGAPPVSVGEERLFLLGQRADGTLFMDNGPSGSPLLARAGAVKPAGANVADPNAAALLSAAKSRYPDAAGPDLTAQAAIRLVPLAVNGVATDASGIAPRFTAGDRGESIEYLVDADALPAGMTLAQGLNAVSNAFRAWENASSLHFRFIGMTSFGMASPNIATNDGRIRVQLHDSYNYITDSSIVGFGGNAYSTGGFASGGSGGNVAGNEFYHTLRGFVVMKHTQNAMETVSSFEEVLCHEIGHALSMEHSSTNGYETNDTLRQSIMYYYLHLDGRGARLSSYDPPVIQQMYPTNNTPPWSYDRVMDVVTQPSGAPNLAGINQIELRGYNLQGNALTVSLTNYSGGAGAYSLNGSTLSFTPTTFANASRLDPADGTFHHNIYFRFSDGTNASPFYTARVISLQPDQNPSGASDGLPDAWVAQYFGSASASIDPDADADGDGVSNRDEFRQGTDPTSASSVLRFTSVSASGLNWFARPYDLYEVQATTDFTNWFRAGNPVVPMTTNGSFINFPALTNCLFFRVLRVP